jgi:hypothetical protein
MHLCAWRGLNICAKDMGNDKISNPALSLFDKNRLFSRAAA